MGQKNEPAPITLNRYRLPLSTEKTARGTFSKVLAGMSEECDTNRFILALSTRPFPLIRIESMSSPPSAYSKSVNLAMVSW